MMRYAYVYLWDMVLNCDTSPPGRKVIVGSSPLLSIIYCQVSVSLLYFIQENTQQRVEQMMPLITKLRFHKDLRKILHVQKTWIKYKF